MKKWLSYREKPLLGRGLKREQMREVAHMARRIATLLLAQPALDANYRAVRKNAKPLSRRPAADSRSGGGLQRPSCEVQATLVWTPCVSHSAAVQPVSRPFASEEHRPCSRPRNDHCLRMVQKV
ncbi:MAG: hypothetical protein LLG45_08340 [Actinomycetia bacterium]|nr:hypothetical protein [Actinomycetes bacterium]